MPVEQAISHLIYLKSIFIHIQLTRKAYTNCTQNAYTNRHSSLNEIQANTSSILEPLLPNVHEFFNEIRIDRSAYINRAQLSQQDLSRS